MTNSLGDRSGHGTRPPVPGREGDDKNNLPVLCSSAPAGPARTTPSVPCTSWSTPVSSYRVLPSHCTKPEPSTLLHHLLGQHMTSLPRTTSRGGGRPDTSGRIPSASAMLTSPLQPAATPSRVCTCRDGRDSLSPKTTHATRGQLSAALSPTLPCTCCSAQESLLKEHDSSTGLPFSYLKGLPCDFQVSSGLSDPSTFSPSLGSTALRPSLSPLSPELSVLRSVGP